jgi:hypothetical protein
LEVVREFITARPVEPRVVIHVVEPVKDHVPEERQA